jgi:hypothetical protein
MNMKIDQSTQENPEHFSALKLIKDFIIKKLLLLFIATVLFQVILLAQSTTDLQVQDTRYISTSPSSYTKVLQAHFKYHNAIGLHYQGTGYSTVLGLRGWVSDNTGGKAHELAFSDDNQIRFRSGYSPSWEAWRRIITEDNNGNVGIGTTEPQAKLDIVGQINSYVVGLGQQTYTSSTRNHVNFSSNNHGSVLLSSNLYFNGDDNLKIAKTHPSMSGSAILIPGNGQSNQGSILFYTAAPASVTADANFNSGASMIVKSNGNVGIGTTNPDSKLTVAGDIQSRKVKVTINAGADFVFEEDYYLKKLEDLQKYIQQHKHLPEIPSAKEMETKGIELGEMNIKLLQKIEELTLYLIEMKKENELLNKKVDQLTTLIKKDNQL